MTNSNEAAVKPTAQRTPLPESNSPCAGPRELQGPWGLGRNPDSWCLGFCESLISQRNSSPQKEYIGQHTKCLNSHWLPKAIKRKTLGLVVGGGPVEPAWRLCPGLCTPRGRDIITGKTAPRAAPPAPGAFPFRKGSWLNAARSSGYGARQGEGLQSEGLPRNTKRGCPLLVD